MTAGVTLETTPGCTATLRVLWALEELGASVALVVHPDGHFRARHGAAGPRWVAAGEEEGAAALGFEAILDRLRQADPGRRLQPEGTERWCRWYLGVLLPAVQALGAAMSAGRSPGPEVGAVLPLLDELEAHLAAAEVGAAAGGALEAPDGPWIAGALGLADCALLGVRELARRWPPFMGRYPAIAGWVARAEARPAFRRASARLREAFAPPAG